MTWKLVVALSFLALCFSAPQKNAERVERTPRIVNGTDSDIRNFPFIVSLQGIYNDTHSFHSCGASILNDYWILTAAHCVHNGNPDNMLVEYGSTEISNGLHGEKIALVDQLIWHETYDPEELKDDIALVKLKTPIELDFTDYQVRLPIKGSYFSTGTPAVLAGWGRIGTNMPISTILQEVDLQIYSSYDCAALHQYNVFYTNICAGVPSGGKGQCNGDSGGPLLVDNVQVGIVSWSMKPCTIAPFPGVFTAVSQYIDWIEVNTGLTLKKHMFLQVVNE